LLRGGVVLTLAPGLSVLNLMVENKIFSKEIQDADLLGMLTDG
jgi:hypothetical protein